MTKPGAAAAWRSETIGEREIAVNFLPNFLARTRMRKRVGIGVVPARRELSLELRGHRQAQQLAPCPTSALTKTALPP